MDYGCCKIETTVQDARGRQCAISDRLPPPIALGGNLWLHAIQRERAGFSSNCQWTMQQPQPRIVHTFRWHYSTGLFLQCLCITQRGETIPTFRPVGREAGVFTVPRRMIAENSNQILTVFKLCPNLDSV